MTEEQKKRNEVVKLLLVVSTCLRYITALRKRQYLKSLEMTILLKPSLFRVIVRIQFVFKRKLKARRKLKECMAYHVLMIRCKHKIRRLSTYIRTKKATLIAQFLTDCAGFSNFGKLMKNFRFKV